MFNLGYDLINFFSKIKEVLTPELLTILVLVFVLFRKFIVDFLVGLVRLIFSIEEKDRDKQQGSNAQGNTLKVYIIFLGAYLIGKIWIKSPTSIIFIDKVFKILTILFAGKIVADFFTTGSILYKILVNSKSTNVVLNKFLSNFAKICVYIITIFIVITELGYNINGLVAGLGIGSAVIALALQDVVKNIASGATIITEKPFEIGDWIELAGATGQTNPNNSSGTVEDITLRSIKVRKIDSSVVFIPNNKITTECVINYSKINRRMYKQCIYLPFTTPVEKINKITRRLEFQIDTNASTVEDSTYVKLDEITQEGYCIKIFCYISEYKFIRFLNIKDEINKDVINILNQEGVSPLYHPKQDVTVLPKVENEPVEYIK